MKVPILSDLKSQGESPEYLFWVGCAGSFDDRSKKVTKAFVKILNKANISYAILLILFVLDHILVMNF